MDDEGFTGLRTLVVGLDGIDRNVLERVSDETISNVTEILESGASGPLESQLPPWTPSAWPSMYTGVNPGKHGVFGFLRFEGYDWDVVNYTDVREYALWELLDQHGLTSVVVNVPVTHPPDEFDGALVPGYTAPEDPDCHPAGLLDELREAIGEYRVYDESSGDDTSPQQQVARYADLIEMRGAAFRYLHDRFDPDFGFLQFQQTDTVFHEFPENDEVVEGVFDSVDDELGRVLDATDPDYVFLVSDHGIGPYDGHEFRPNTFLRDEGFVETTTGEGRPSWSQIATNRLQNGETEPTDAEAPSILERSLSVAAAAGLTSQRIGSILDRLGLADHVLKIVPADAVMAASEHVKFSTSRAYMRDRIEMGIRINLEGREPDGTVPPGEYEVLRNRLISELERVTTPAGDPVFDDVLPREDVFHGPYVDEAPDVVLVPASFDQYLSASIRDEQFGEPREPWNHKLHGLVAVTGDDVETRTLRSAHLLDVAPTILATLGVPTSDRMDGSALPVVDPPDRSSYPQYERDENVPTEDEGVERQLANLGYLE